jgi:putative ABC transport system substrate-binding protein
LGATLRRREFITLLGGAAAAWPIAARAQQTMPVIGYLNLTPAGANAFDTAGFFQGLGEIGYVEGRNVTIEYRSADFRADRLPALAVDLVQRRVSLIAAIGGPASAIAAKAATTTIPIVFVTGGDPVQLGLVASLNQPGVNLTGVSFLTNALGSKRLELLLELVPSVDTIGFLADPTNPNTEPETADMLAAASALKRKLLVVRSSTASEVDAAFASLAGQRAGALVVAPGVLHQPARSAPRIGAAPRFARDLSKARIRLGRRADELWHQHHGCASPSRPLRRQDSQGRTAGGFADHAVGEIRAGH